MAKRYYTGTGDREKGPFTLKQLRVAVQQVSLSRSTLVRAEDETTRKPIGELLIEEDELLIEEERIRLGGFCDKCIVDTTEQSPGHLRTVNGVGWAFYGESKRCPRCASVVRVVWLAFFFVPLIPIGTYRYRKIAGNLFSERFVARRLRPGRPGEVRARGYLIAWGVVITALVLFAHDRGVNKDEAQAAALYTKACDGGNAGACKNLGILLARKCKRGDQASCTEMEKRK